MPSLPLFPGSSLTLQTVDLTFSHPFNLLQTLGGSGTGKIKLKPVLMQKGNTRIALYGLGYIRDARLHQMFSVKGNVEWARPEDKEGMRTASWFNAMLIHQNRVHHSPKNAISERYLPSWLDLVVWGHEHECLVEPTEDAAGNFSVTQPGSSVVTSLIEGEAKKKQVLLLEVRADDDNPDSAPFWRTNPIPLETVRPFKYRQIALQDKARMAVEDGGLGPDWEAALPTTGPAGRRGRSATSEHDAWIQGLLERNVNEMIAEAVEPYRARGSPESDIPLPLIRLRVDYSGGFSTINGQRFGQKFVGKVANPNDLLQFHKSLVRKKKEAEGVVGRGGGADVEVEEEAIGNPQLQDQRRIEQLVNTNLTAGLQLLSEMDMSNALDDFINRDPSAIDKLVKQRINETQALVEEEGDVDELGNPDDAMRRIEEAVQQRLARSAPTAVAATAAVRENGANGDAPPPTEEPTPMETAARERERTLRMMDAAPAPARANGAGPAGALDDNVSLGGPRSASDVPGRAPATTSARSRGTASASAPSRGTRAGRGTGQKGLDAFLAPSQVSARPAAAAGRTRGGKSGRVGRGRADVANSDDDDDDDDDDVVEDSGDEDVVELSAPAEGRRRPTRATAAAKAAAATRRRVDSRRRHVETPAETPDAFGFDGSEGDGKSDDEEEVEDSGDDEAIATNASRRGQKRGRAANGGGGQTNAMERSAKSARGVSGKALTPPGRQRAPRVIEIDEDSGDDDHRVPATAASRGTRRSARGR